MCDESMVFTMEMDSRFRGNDNAKRFCCGATLDLRDASADQAAEAGVVSDLRDGVDSDAGGDWERKSEAL